jgi:hypothetical protein
LFADEDAGGEVRPEEVVAVRAGAACGGGLKGAVGPVEARLRRAGGEDAVGVVVIGKDGADAFDGEVRVAFQVVDGEVVMPEPGGVVVAEPVAPVIAAAAKLRLARDEFDLAGVGLKTDVVAADVNWLRVEG